MTFHKENISSEEAERISNIATKIAFELSFCGPIQVENRNGKTNTHTIIKGFDEEKAKIIVEDLLWRFLLIENYGKATQR